jgi:hypothetical protein
MSLPSSGLPQVIQGPFGGSRLIGVPSIAGIANGQLYDVRISSLHSNQVDQTDFGSTQCMRTYGFAGSPMLPIEAQENTFGNGVVVSIYPNPNNGQKVNFNINGMDGSLNLKVTDATGREVYNNRYLVEGSMNTTLDFGQALADGMYMVEMLQNGELKTMRMVVSK